MTRVSSSLVTTSFVLVLAIACGGDDKSFVTLTGSDAGPDAGSNGGNGGAANGGNGGNGGNANGGSNGMDAAAPDASTNATPDGSSPDGGPAGSNDSGIDSGTTDGGYADAGDGGDAGVCGNGDLEPGEGCDDGNTNSGDGCTGDCWAFELTQTVTAGPGLALAIPDGTYAGTEGTMGCVSLVAGTWAGDDISSVTVQVGITHTWIGDLVIKLISPANTVVTLLNRPGFAETADDGVETTVGGHANLSSAAPITFSESAGLSAEAMGTGFTSAEVVCVKDAVCSFLPNAGAATAGTLAAFNGQSSPGTWKLCVGDVNGLDTGSIDAVTLTLEH
jgi:cysteine-rich repeat protein